MTAAAQPLVRRVLLPFAFAYVLSYLYRTVNAVVSAMTGTLASTLPRH